YSALSFVGLVPAALLGVDIERVLHSAAAMRNACGASVAAQANPGARLGAYLAESALMGRDYLSLDPAESYAEFPAWVQQLVAESTGKEGQGILPISGDAAAAVLGESPRWYTVDARQI